MQRGRRGERRELLFAAPARRCHGSFFFLLIQQLPVEYACSASRAILRCPSMQFSFRLCDALIAPLNLCAEEQQRLFVLQECNVQLVPQTQTRRIHLFRLDAKTAVAIMPVLSRLSRVDR